MRIGIFAGTVGAAPDLKGQIRQVAEAEEDGFDSFWSAQILGVDALTLLALSGQKTSRIEMGTAVVPIFPHHPLTLAQQALTTQAATGGRLSLGIGLAHKPTVEGRLGMTFDRPARRMEEYLSVLRALVHEGKVEFAGQIFRVNAALQIPDARPCPILVAALAPRMLRIAGELAEGTVTWMTGPRTLSSHIVPRITASTEAAGRPAPRICVGLPIAVTDDRATARETAGRLFERYGQLPSYRRMMDIEEVEGAADMAIIGDEAEVERRLREIKDAGATDLLASVFPVGEDTKASVSRTRTLLKELVGRT